MAKILHAILVVMFSVTMKESCWVSGSFEVDRGLGSNDRRIDILRAKRSTSCVDSYSKCSYWKSLGWCNHYKNYCRKTCDPLCQNCRNRYAQKSCDTWVIGGYCKSTKYGSWMKINCAKSCGHCQCKNDNKYCSDWARKGECQKNPNYMLLNCKLSCGVCGSKTTKKPITKPSPKTSKPTPKPTTKTTTNPTTVARRTCGISSTAGGRIVGGKFAQPGEWPWHAAITHCLNCSKLPFCGGTLINNEWVVTAAHCLYGWQASDLFVILGETNFLQRSRHEVIRKVRTIYSHYDYGIAARFDYDIALLRLNRTVKFTHHIQPACLPPLQPKLPAGKNCTVTGFGQTSEGGLKSPRLQQATVPLISDSECKKVVGTSASLRITSTMFCAGHIRGGIDACQGDSGGPLVCKSDDGSYELAGVVSWGKGCARANRYGVYADVQVLRGWIENMMAGKTRKSSTK